MLRVKRPGQPSRKLSASTLTETRPRPQTDSYLRNSDQILTLSTVSRQLCNSGRKNKVAGPAQPLALKKRGWRWCPLRNQEKHAAARNFRSLARPGSPAKQPQLTAVSPSLSLLAEMSALRFSALKSPRWKSPMSGNFHFSLCLKVP